MRHHAAIRRLLILAVCAVLVAGCAKGRKDLSDATIPGSLGVAAFTQPAHAADLLGGSIPDWATPVDRDMLSALDRALHNQVVIKRGRTFTEYQVVRRCQEIEDSGVTGSGQTALEYWLHVGRCVGVDFLLVPQLTALRTKDIAKEQPAAVAYELSLVDVREARLLKRFHYEEEQRFLTDNILDLGKFLERGGKWISAVELATEGFEKAVEELWL